MDGPALLTYLKRRLAIEGLTDQQLDDTELFDDLTEGRDELVQAFALAAPIVVQQQVTLDPVVGQDRLFDIPAATKDPLRIIRVRSVTTRERLNPSAVLDEDGGDYEWLTTRRLRLAENVEPTGGVEVFLIPHAVAITAGTAEAAVGLPTPCHRAIGKFAAVLALTANEESDATEAKSLFGRELDRLERLYGDFDADGGMALREALLQSYGNWLGDSLY